MASQDLVGRPLVPFFDEDNNINDSLQLNDNEREEIDVDARVWDRELGYFVYPADKQRVTPDTVANLESRTESGSKLLLTPSMMLSSSALDHLTTGGPPVRAITAIVGNTIFAPNDAFARSNSTKRVLKQKSRTTMPGQRLKEKARGDHECTSKSASGLLTKIKTNGGNTISSGIGTTQLRIVQQKEQLSASGKWAWSAFQSSPDPTELPMPPFLTKPLRSLFSVATAPIISLSQPAQVPIAPPLPPDPPLIHPPRPTAPPEIASSARLSAEVSMTQDLCRMLNIDGR